MTDKKEIFRNPYEGDQDVGRVTTDIARADYMLVKLIRPTSGTISGTLGLLWNKLCDELRKRNITDNSQCNEFEHFLANSRLVPNDEYETLTSESAQWRQQQIASGAVSGRPNRGPSRKAARPNVRQRTEGLGDTHSAEQNQSPDLQSQGGEPSGQTGNSQAGQGTGEPQ